MTTTLPCAGPAPRVKVFGSPGMLVARVATEPESGLFSAVEAESPAALTGSGATVSVTVAVEVAPDASVTT